MEERTRGQGDPEKEDGAGGSAGGESKHWRWTTRHPHPHIRLIQQLQASAPPALRRCAATGIYILYYIYTRHSVRLPCMHLVLVSSYERSEICEHFVCLLPWVVYCIVWTRYLCFLCVYLLILLNLYWFLFTMKHILIFKANNAIQCERHISFGLCFPAWLCSYFLVFIFVQCTVWVRCRLPRLQTMAFIGWGAINRIRILW